MVLTDFDELVLEKLEENVRQSQSSLSSLLHDAAPADSPSLCILDEMSDVAVKRLDWMDALEDPTSLKQEVAAIDPDIILAADVVRSCPRRLQRSTPYLTCLGVRPPRSTIPI